MNIRYLHGKKNNFIAVSFFTLVLFSCSPSAKHMTDLFSDIECYEEDSVLLELDSIRNPYMMEYVCHRLYFADLYQDTFIRTFDWDSGKYLMDFAKKGMGPDEFLYFTVMTAFENKLYLWDTNKGTIFKADFRDEKKEPVFTGVKIPSDSLLLAAFKVLPIKNGKYVATGLIKGKRLAVIDSEGQVVTTFGDYPKEHAGQTYTDIENGFAYQGFMAYSPEKESLAVGSMNGESISFYDMHDIQTPRLIKEYICSFPQYDNDSSSEAWSVVFRPDNVNGFIELKSSSDYCIGLFSGVSRTEEETYGGNMILLFDWEGNPIKIIKLKYRYTNMAFNESKKELILFGKNPDTFNFMVTKVDLSIDYK